MPRAIAFALASVLSCASLVQPAQAILPGAFNPYYRGKFGMPHGASRVRDEVWVSTGNPYRGASVSLWCNAWGGHFYEFRIPRPSFRRERGGYGFNMSVKLHEVQLGEGNHFPPQLTVTIWIKGKLIGSRPHPKGIRGTLHTSATHHCGQSRVPYLARYFVPHIVECGECEVARPKATARRRKFNGIPASA